MTEKEAIEVLGDMCVWTEQKGCKSANCKYMKPDAPICGFCKLMNTPSSWNPSWADEPDIITVNGVKYKRCE